MAFDPVTLLTLSVVVLVALGSLMLHASRGEQACLLLRWSGAAFLCLGLGFAMVLAAPTDIQAPVRVFGNAALLLPYGFLWAGARRFGGRPVSFEPVVAGALAWLLAVSLVDLGQAWRVGLTSAIVALYSGAIAWEHHRGDGAGSAERLRAQRWASWIFAGHGSFFALRCLLGPSLGLAAWGPDIAQFWGALLGLETVVVASLLAVVSLAMSRELTARQHRREALEDVLTGIGNRRALFRSGGVLLDACHRAGRPAALLLMDLDGFKAVNDRHGHPLGDRLLVAFGRLAHDYLPPTSLVCRVGGEEFAAVLPDAEPERARIVADEIRALFAHVVLDGPQGPVRTTVSIGIAQMDAVPPGVRPPQQDMADLLGRADQCLYFAKNAGRDRVVAEHELRPADPSRAGGGRRSAA